MRYTGGGGMIYESCEELEGVDSFDDEEEVSDPMAACFECGRSAFESCGQCGASLCPNCFESGAGFCGRHPDKYFAGF